MPDDNKTGATGHPAGTGDGGTPQVEKVKIGDAEYEVPAPLASALKAVQSGVETTKQELDRKSAAIDEQARFLQQLISTAKPNASAPANSGEEQPDWLLAPEVAAEKLRKQIADEMDKKLKGVVTQYQREQYLKNFWDGFYTANQDLKPFNGLMESMFQSRFSEIQDLTPDKAQAKLAEIARSEIGRIAQTFNDPNKKGDTTRTGTTGGGGNPGAQHQDTGGGTQPETLSQVIKFRRQARRQASK